MSKPIPWRILALCLALVAAPGALAAQPPAPAAAGDQPRKLDDVFMWRALAAGPADNPVCYVTHQAEAVQIGPRAAPRPMVFVAWRPAKASANVVGVFPSYRLKPGSELVMEFSAYLSFKLYTTPDSAWAWTSEDDTAIVQAMRLGVFVTLRGTSEAGEAMVNTVSLAGFTAASARAMQACPPR